MPAAASATDAPMPAKPVPTTATRTWSAAGAGRSGGSVGSVTRDTGNPSPPSRAPTTSDDTGLEQRVQHGAGALPAQFDASRLPPHRAPRAQSRQSDGSVDERLDHH